jgi:hypothetical protein
VGLGGFKLTDVDLGIQNNVAQAGVDIYAACYASASGAYAWVEWFPGPSVELFSVNPGDDIYASVQSNSSTSATFALSDFTAQQFASYEISAPKGVVNAGNEAE